MYEVRKARSFKEAFKDGKARQDEQDAVIQRQVALGRRLEKQSREVVDLSSKSALVYDNGLFVEIAIALAKGFGHVYYYCPWAAGYPNSNPLWIGKGIHENVTRVSSIWDVMERIDVAVFPDVYEGALQVHLESMGMPVWGSRTGEVLELDRVKSKQIQKERGIAIGKYKVVTGIPALREYLKEHDNVWVKVSATRGDMETFCSKNYKLIEPRIDDLEHKLGAKKGKIEFIVEDSIEPAVEVGYDGFTIDGEFPKTTLYGIEVKDKGYIGRVKDYNKLPPEVTDVNTRLSDYLKEVKYRNFFSAELRITQPNESGDRTAWSIDPCARCGSPPSELYGLMMANLPIVIWEGAHGILQEPEYTAEWAAELLIHSSWAGEKQWQALEFPPDIRENVKLRNLSVIDGKHYVVPDPAGMPEIGAVVANGSTMEEAIKNCRAIAEKVEGHNVTIFSDALDEAQGEIDKLGKYGIEF